MNTHTVRMLSPLRKTIAARMSEAARTIPHFRVAVDVEVDTLLALRARANAADASAKITVNDCIIKGCAAALMKHPAINSQLVGDEVHEYHQADVSVVLALPGGLVTPVVRGADRKSVREISDEVKALATRAASGRLKISEIMGGSFTVSNLGARGVAQFDAIINAPQCAILAVAAARPQVVATVGGDWRVATVVRATLSVDHRAVDGALAADFLSTMRQVLEQPQDIFR
jgi:pyruvate dehydrogenase E2 component (dihydrolipoamide acetyltransferase)